MRISRSFVHGLTVSALALIASAPALAQEIDIGEVVVTPNRAPTDKTKVGSKVERVTKQEIEQRSQPTVLDYLKAVPGIHVASPGGMGQEASVSMRGADKKYIKTLFNGIDVSDVTAPQVQTSYQYLLSGGIVGIEVLKGPQSTLYGSDAVAGVVGMSTLGEIEPGIHHEVTGEYGSRNTVRGGYSLSGAGERGKASFSINGLSTDGFSVAKRNGGGAVDLNPARLEPDAFKNLNANFAGEYKLTDQFSVFGSLLYIKGQAEYDDSGTFPSYLPTDNSFNVGGMETFGGRVGFNLDLLDGRFRNTFSAQMLDVDRETSSRSAFGPFDGTWNGKRQKLDYQGAFDATDWLTLQFGADYERQQADVRNNFGTNTSDSFYNAGGWGQVLLEPVENFTFSAAYRHDTHKEFGGHGSYRFTSAYAVPDWGTKFHASYGTGFRAPSIYELYAPGAPWNPEAGNPNLKPEESRGFDFGIEQRFFDGRLVADITYFQLDTDRLIDYRYDPTPGVPDYNNIAGTTKRRGVELSATWAATSWLDLGAAYTYTHTRQPDGARRPRVPRHDFVLSAAVRPAEKWEVSTQLQVVADVTDRTAAGDFKLGDYVLFDAKVAYKPTEKTELYLRGENLFNQKYETVRGYATPGASVYAGFKAKF